MKMTLRSGILTAALFGVAAPTALAQSPYAIIGTAEQSEGPRTWPDDARLNVAVDEILKQWENAGFHGSALLAGDGEVLLRRGYGKANVELDVDNTPETRYGGAFLGRLFTAAALGILVEQGRVDLDAPMGRYLPELPGHIADRSLRGPLSSRSGLDQDLLGLAGAGPTEPLGDLGDLLEIAATATATGPTGTYAYSGPEAASVDDVLLAAVVERVAGQRFEDFVASALLEPLALTDTGFLTTTRLVPGLASRYQTVAGQLEPFPSSDFSYLLPTGALYSTVSDVFRFVDQVLDDHALGALVAATLEANIAGRTFGVRDGAQVAAEDVAPDERHTILGTEGWIRGTTIHAYGIRPGRHWLIVLSNVHASTMVYDVRRRWSRLVVGLPVGLPPVGRGAQMWQALRTEGPEAAAQVFARLGPGAVGDMPISDNLGNEIRELRATGRMPLALRVAELYALIDPDNWRGHYERGRILLEMSEADAGLQAFQRALQLEPAADAAATMQAAIERAAVKPVERQ